MRHILLVLTLVFLGVMPLHLQAQETSPATAAGSAPAAGKTFSDADKVAIEEIIKNYITKDHPEILMQAMQELQKRDQATAQTKSEEAIRAGHDKIFADSGTPVGGNPKGDVTLVEFFDFNCGYCKMSEPDLEKLLKDDKNIKIIYKDFPILGPVSTTASQIALAANIQGGYIKYHDALMSKKDHLSEDIILQTAKDVGLDVDKLKKDSTSDVVINQIKANLELGKDVGVRGTPMFIIGDQVFPGALMYDQLKKAVDDARASAKKK